MTDYIVYVALLVVVFLSLYIGVALLYRAGGKLSMVLAAIFCLSVAGVITAGLYVQDDGYAIFYDKADN